NCDHGSFNYLGKRPLEGVEKRIQLKKAHGPKINGLDPERSQHFIGLNSNHTMSSKPKAASN
ncbi:hypothetical protein ACNQS2_11395, partial [Corynebacterium diphtheriae]